LFYTSQIILAEKAVVTGSESAFQVAEVLARVLKLWISDGRRLVSGLYNKHFRYGTDWGRGIPGDNTG
jgi:hypothetical protein